MVFYCTIFYATHPGSREENQDNYLIPGERIKKLTQPVFHSGQKELRLSPGKTIKIAVSDGMGGEQNGAIASRTVLKALKKSSDTEDRVDQINDAVLSAQIKYGNCGATLVCADFKSDGSSVITYVEAVGDSPCFLIRDGEIVKITRDDNLYQQLLEEDNLPDDEEEIANAKAGLFEYFGKQTVETQFYRLFVEPGDIFVLSSDGVLLEEDDYPFFMESGVENPAEDLVLTSVSENMELSGGNSDNVTAVIITFEKEGATE